jgi:hypothetical protein
MNNKPSKKLGIFLFFVIYIWCYSIFNAVNARADDIKPQLPNTDKEMCQMFLKAEICAMTQAQQETYFLNFFKALIDSQLQENLKEHEKEGHDICLKQLPNGKFIKCNVGEAI